MKRLRLTVLMDGACVSPDNPEFLGSPEVQSTEFHVVTALRELGHEVFILGVGRNIEDVIHRLGEQSPDLVFNLTEEFRGDRLQDRNIAALLELLGIPFTGTGATGLMLCRGKGLCKQILSHHRVRVPGFVVLPPGKVVRAPKAMRYPFVVKPAYEDGSVGISNASLVKDENELKERVQLIHERWKQPAIAEEYIGGREFYIGVVGNKRLTVLPARELFFNKTGENGPVLATYRVKWNEEYQKKWGIEFGYAEIDEATSKRIERVCKRVYRLLQLQDFGRLDVRLTPEGNIVILEVNPNPDIAYGEEVAEAAEKIGIPYNKLIARIVHLALRRYKR